MNYWIFLTASFIGFLDALYLSLKHYQGAAIICSVLDGCEKVTASAYSTIGGIPVAYLGTLYYSSIFLLTIWFLFSKNENFLLLAAGLTLLGFFASFWFVYLQFFVIKAICLYCMISAAMSTLLFFSGLYFLILRKRSLKMV